MQAKRRQCGNTARFVSNQIMILNIEYLANTLAHLDVLGIRERELERLAVLVFGMARWERIGVLEDCPRLKGLTRATARRPISFVRLRKDQRRRFGHRKFLS